MGERGGRWVVSAVIWGVVGCWWAPKSRFLRDAPAAGHGLRAADAGDLPPPAGGGGAGARARPPIRLNHFYAMAGCLRLGAFSGFGALVEPATHAAATCHSSYKKKRGRKNTNTKFKNIKYFGGLATSTTTSSRTPVSFVSSPLETGNSLLSLSDKSAVAVVGDLDVDCATGSFCSSCAIPPRVVGGLGVME